MKILLISGHGAGDPGASGNGYKEADLTIEVVKLLKAKLDKYATVDLYDISKNAFKDYKVGKFKISDYDYVLEVHFNSAGASANGTEIYVTTLETGTSVEQKIVDNLSKYFKNRGVKKENFAVIYKCKKLGMSSALLEVCFISNKKDIATYQKNKDAIITTIANSIIDGFGLKKTTTAKANSKATTTSQYYSKYTGASMQIDTVLKAIEVPVTYYGSYVKRKKVAAANGISNYIGSSSQNLKIISLAKSGKLKKVS